MQFDSRPKDTKPGCKSSRRARRLKRLSAWTSRNPPPVDKPFAKGGGKKESEQEVTEETEGKGINHISVISVTSCSMNPRPNCPRLVATRRRYLVSSFFSSFFGSSINSLISPPGHFLALIRSRYVSLLS